MTLRTMLMLSIAAVVGLLGGGGGYGVRISIPVSGLSEYHLHTHSHGGHVHVNAHNHPQREMPEDDSAPRGGDACGGVSGDDHHCCCESEHHDEGPGVAVLAVRPKVRSHSCTAICRAPEDFRAPLRMHAAPSLIRPPLRAGRPEHLFSLRTVVLLT